MPSKYINHKTGVVKISPVRCFMCDTFDKDVFPFFSKMLCQPCIDSDRWNQVVWHKEQRWPGWRTLQLIFRRELLALGAKENEIEALLQDLWAEERKKITLVEYAAEQLKLLREGPPEQRARKSLKKAEAEARKREKWTRLSKGVTLIEAPDAPGLIYQIEVEGYAGRYLVVRQSDGQHQVWVYDTRGTIFGLRDHNWTVAVVSKKAPTVAWLVDFHMDTVLKELKEEWQRRQKR